MQLIYSASLAITASSIFSLVWVWFWTRKQAIDNRATITVFIGGIISVLLALSLQKILDILIPNTPLIVVILWATIEEIFKLAVVLYAIRLFKFDKTKIIVYMILVALGFAFLENIIYAIFNPINNLNGLLLNLQRSIGATLMHIVSSSVIGTALAFSFYKSIGKRTAIVVTAVILAIVFHTFYNLIVTNLDNLSDWFGLTFIIIWIFMFALVWIVYRKEGTKTLMSQIGVFVFIIVIILSGIIYIQPKTPKYSPETISSWKVMLKNVEESRAGFTNENAQLVKSISALDSIFFQLMSVVSAMENNKALSNEEKKFMENYNMLVDEYNCILRKEEVGDSTDDCAFNLD